MVDGRLKNEARARGVGATSQKFYPRPPVFPSVFPCFRGSSFGSRLGFVPGTVMVDPAPTEPVPSSGGKGVTSNFDINPNGFVRDGPPRAPFGDGIRDDFYRGRSHLGERGVVLDGRSR